MARAGYVPERGDLVRVVQDPRVGREQSGERPALVLTPRRFNELTGYAFVAPITSTTRGWPFEVPVPAGARVQGVVQADQARASTTRRVLSASWKRHRMAWSVRCSIA